MGGGVAGARDVRGIIPESAGDWRGRGGGLRGCPGRAHKSPEKIYYNKMRCTG